ncbi:MAG: hypothetical protein K6F23_07015 [Solobacterium sp.]|nr:hypothetical protein [Solobacterium sp.]
MFTSDKEKALRSGLLYGYAALFFAAFGAVYELFSHEVYSYYMIYAFMIPAVLGVVPYFGVYHLGLHLPSGIVTQLYASGVMTLTMGSIMRGVLDIYGTTSDKLVLYLYAGTVLYAAGIAAFVYINRKPEPEKKQDHGETDPALVQN